MTTAQHITTNKMTQKIQRVISFTSRATHDRSLTVN